MEKHVLLKKLRDALESLKGRVAGKNNDDVVEAIAMVSFGYHFICVFCFLLSEATLTYHVPSSGWSFSSSVDSEGMGINTREVRGEETSKFS